jgi:opacity protein-like surface antigen
MFRRIVLLAMLAALAAGTANAGLLPTFGVKGGINMSTVDLDDLDASNRTGFVGGAFVNLAYPGLNFQIEGLYSTKGFKEGKPTGTTQLDYNMACLQFPVLMKLSLPIPAVTPSVYAGPALSFVTKAEFEDGDGNVTDVKDDTESSYWSVIVGADLTLMGSLIVDVRYDIGLNALNKDSFTNLDKDIKDRTFTVMAGFAF